MHPLKNINKEFIPYRWNNGIKLLEPNSNEFFNSEFLQSTIFGLNELSKMPFNVYLVNRDSVIQFANESTIETCGFQSTHDALGNTIAKVAKKETALFEFAHEQKVIAENKMIIMQENYQRHDDDNNPYIAFKFPWYNLKNEIIGVFGCSLSLTGNSFNFSDLLSILVNTGILNTIDLQKSQQAFSKLKIDGVSLSQREVDCLKFLCKGFTAKQISKVLNISHRTVENYLANIKNKLHVSTKSELIEKIINYSSQITN